MQFTILMFFQQLANPFLDFVSQFFTFFGESIPVIVIVLAIYWCDNKSRGFSLFMTLASSLIFVNIIKPIFHVARPFVKHPEIQGKRISTATGFSFPSGHTTTASTFYTSLALGTKNKKRWITAAIVLSVIVGISRMYLGVHWPTDVLAGFIIGLLASFLLYNFFTNFFEHKNCEITCLVVGLLCLVTSITFTVILTLNPELKINFSDLMKSLALTTGGLLGVYWDKTKINFSTSGSLGKKAVRFLVGLMGLLIISCIKFLFPGNLYFIGSLLKYSLIGLWATALFPFIAIKLNLMNHEN